MSPERALELYRRHAWACHPLMNHEAVVRDAILAACAEAEREAYTRAAEACNLELLTDGNSIGLDHYNAACNDCAAAIEKLRDK